MVTIKHDAYSLEDVDGFTGHNFNAVISNYTLYDTYFPAFQNAIMKCNAKAIMCSYNAVNGIPTLIIYFDDLNKLLVWPFMMV